VIDIDQDLGSDERSSLFSFWEVRFVNNELGTGGDW
jgi:hypothetical protein